MGRFNPRLRTGGDRLARNPKTAEKYVSIHASAREATIIATMRSKAVYVVSIHASAREATGFASRRLLRAASFNPRLRTGGDK